MKTTRFLNWIGIVFCLVVIASGCTSELIVPPPPEEIALLSFHGRYLTALGEEEGWKLGQKTKLDSCGEFTLGYLANGKVTLKTCYDRYVTAPETGIETVDWLITQETKLERCGQFDLYELGDNRVALKTCANRFLTPGGEDEKWSGELAWSVVGETEYMDEWEILIVQVR